MTSKPILFSGPMVRAILDERKHQTRRVLKPQPVDPWYWPGDEVDPESGWFDRLEQGREPCGAPAREYTPPIKLPYALGDLLWCRETWVHTGDGVWTVSDAMRWPGRSLIKYRADGEAPSDQWFPSIHMPRWASRLTLEVTDVRIERIQQISEVDAFAEGCHGLVDGLPHRTGCRRNFAKLWDSLNAKRGYGWDANPWVCAVTFKAHHCNVDAMEKAA